MPGAQAPIQTRPDPPAAPAAPATPADPLAEAPRISAADAKKVLDAGQAVLVDVRSLDSWQEEHAKGAVSIPVNEIYARLGELPKDKQVIAYCT
jgi:3-mercaptopyruvate sulfurtransferase SseA